MRQDVSFTSRDLQCRGWLYIPDDLAPGAKAPALVMAHGFCALKEMHLPNFAERFVEAGFVTLVFDYRFFGESEGEPRGRLFPLEQTEDYRNAITWLSSHPQVDPERIGVWGSSFSGGLVLHVAVFDRRVKAAVAQMPSALNHETRRAIDPQRYDRVGEMLLADRIARYRTGEVNYVKVVAPPGEPCVLAPPDAYEWFMRAGKLAPHWRNEVTVESLERQREFNSSAFIHLIAPTPLLMIIAENDTLLPCDALTTVYERAREPKKLITLPCGHFDMYTDPWLPHAVGPAVDWFTEHLGKPAS